MIQNQLSIHGAWWLRTETIEDTVTRLESTYKQLGRLSSRWSSWFSPRPQFSIAGTSETKLSGDPESIRSKLLCSQETTDDGPPLPELGYSIASLSNPANSSAIERSQLRVKACSKSKYSGYNNFVMRIPTAGIAPELYEVGLLCRLIQSVSEIWDPDWLIASDLLNRMVPEPWRPGPVIGWVNYLPLRTCIVEGELPSGWRWFDERNEKQIFYYAGGRPDPNNGTHVLAFKEIFNSIRWMEPPPGVARV